MGCRFSSHMRVMKKDPDANWKVVMVNGKGTAFRTWVGITIHTSRLRTNQKIRSGSGKRLVNDWRVRCKRFDEVRRKRHQLVVDVEVDVEEVPDEDHGSELQRPRNAGGLRLPAPLRRRRHRPRPRRGGVPPDAAGRWQGANAERGRRPAARRRRRRGDGRGSERDVARGQGRGGGGRASRSRHRPGAGRGGRRRRRRHALHLAAPVPWLTELPSSSLD